MALGYPDYYRPDSIAVEEVHEERPLPAKPPQPSNHNAYRYCYAYIRRGYCRLGPEHCKYRHEMPDEEWVRREMPDLRVYPPSWYLTSGVPSQAPSLNKVALQPSLLESSAVAASSSSTAGSSSAATHSSSADREGISDTTSTTPSGPTTSRGPGLSRSTVHQDPEDIDYFLKSLSTLLSRSRAEEICPDSSAMHDTPDTTAKTDARGEIDTAGSDQPSITVQHDTRPSRKPKSKSKKAAVPNVSAPYSSVSAGTQKHRDRSLAEITLLLGADHATWLPDLVVPTDIISSANASDSNKVIFKPAQDWPTKLLAHLKDLAVNSRGVLAIMHECLRQAHGLMSGYRRHLVKGSTTTGALYELMRQACVIASELARAPSVTLGALGAENERGASADPSTTSNIGIAVGKQTEQKPARDLSTDGHVSSQASVVATDEDEIQPTSAQDQEPQVDIKHPQDPLRIHAGTASLPEDDVSRPSKRIKIEHDDQPPTPALTRFTTPSEQSRTTQMAEQELERLHEVYEIARAELAFKKAKAAFHEAKRQSVGMSATSAIGLE